MCIYTGGLMAYINIYTCIIHEKLFDFYIYNIWIYRRGNGIYIALQFAAYGKFFLHIACIGVPGAPKILLSKWGLKKFRGPLNLWNHFLMNRAISPLGPWPVALAVSYTKVLIPVDISLLP